jgi:alpha-glucosidase
MLLLTLRGTPTLYYGDELGIGRVTIPPEAMQDPWEKNEPGLGLSRDPSRTPFQWDNTLNAGFTTGRPWLPLDPGYQACNVEVLRTEPASILSLYRHLIEMRRRHSALSIGAFRLIGAQGDAIVYERKDGGERILICLNLGDREQMVSVPEGLSGTVILVSTHLDRTGPISDLTLRPNEGLTILMAS